MTSAGCRQHRATRRQLWLGQDLQLDWPSFRPPVSSAAWLPALSCRDVMPALAFPSSCLRAPRRRRLIPPTLLFFPLGISRLPQLKLVVVGSADPGERPLSWSSGPHDLHVVLAYCCSRSSSRLSTRQLIKLDSLGLNHFGVLLRDVPDGQTAVFAAVVGPAQDGAAPALQGSPRFCFGTKLRAPCDPTSIFKNTTDAQIFAMAGNLITHSALCNPQSRFCRCTPLRPEGVYKFTPPSPSMGKRRHLGPFLSAALHPASAELPWAPAMLHPESQTTSPP